LPSQPPRLQAQARGAASRRNIVEHQWFAKAGVGTNRNLRDHAVSSKLKLGARLDG